MASALSASLWAMFGSAGTRALSFGAFILIARVLPPSHLGIMAIALSISIFLDALIELGMVDQMIRYQEGNDQAFYSGAFWLQMGVATLGLLLLLALAPWLADWYAEPDLRWALTGVAVSSWFTALGLVPTALLMRDLKQRSIMLRNMVAALAGGCVGIAMAYSGFGVLSLVALQVVNTLTATAVVWHASGWQPSHAATLPSAHLHALTGVKHKALQTLSTRLIEAAVSRIDQLVIGIFFGSSVLGLYALAIRIYDVLFQSLCVAISSVLLPYLAKVDGDMNELRRRYLLAFKTTALVGPPAFLCCALFLPPMLPLLFGAKWAPAGIYIQIILGMGVINAMMFTHTLAFTAVGHPKENLRVATVSSTIWLVCMGFLPLLNTVFGAVFWALRSVVVVLMQLRISKHLLGIQMADYWHATRPLWIACSVVVPMSIFSQNGHAFGLAPYLGTTLTMLTAMLIFAMTAWLSSKHLRSMLKRLLFNKATMSAANRFN